MLQRQIMFKQLQELQRQQKLQELGDAKQQKYINQLSSINKQASGGQFPTLINGTPIQDASQMFTDGNMNSLQHGTQPVIQGFPKGLVFSQAQNQALHSIGPVSQQHDLSLYGTPVASVGNNFNQCSQLHGASNDYVNVFTKGNDNKVEKSTMQSLALNNSFTSDPCIASSDQVFQEKNLFGQVPLLGLNDEILSGNLHQKNASVQDFGGRQEQTSWPRLYSGKTANIGLSHGLASLDPLEQKILFNKDVNSWEADFGKHNSMGTRSFDNTLENTDHLSASPSIHSGSWSALMQSAVAEASSSDTGLQEEWSGLSFQNPELSTDNQLSNFVDSEKQQPNWVDNNLRTTSSLCSKAELLFNDSNMSSGFPGFQQSGIQVSTEQREGICTDSHDESIQHSPKTASKRLHCNPQQKQPIEGSQPVQTLPTWKNAWLGQAYDQRIDQETRVLGENFFQRENSSDSYHPNASPHSIITNKLGEDVWQLGSDSRLVVGGNQKPSDQVLFQKIPWGFSGEQRLFKLTGNISNRSMGLEKDCFPDIERNSETSELPPRSSGGSMSPFFDRLTDFHGSNIISQTGQNMLDLLNKVDKSREQRTRMHFGSSESTPVLVPQAETPLASVAQSNNKYSPSQYFGFRLDPPPQRLSNSDSFDSSQSSPQTGNSIAAFPLDTSYVGNQLQNQSLPAAHVACQSPQATLPGMAGRFPSFNPALSQDTSRLIRTNPYGQQLPILRNVSVTQNSVIPDSQVGFLMNPPNVWTNVPTQQHLSSAEPRKVLSSLLPSPDSVNSSLETVSGAPREQQKQSSSKGENNLQEIGAHSVSSQGFYNGKEPTGERSHQQILLNPVLQTDRLSHGQESAERRLSEANSLAYDSLMTSSHQQGLDGSQYGDNQAIAASGRDLEAFGHSLKPSNVFHQNYSLVHHVHSVNNVETDPSKRISVRNVQNGELNAVSHLNSFSSWNTKIPSFSSNAKGNQSLKALSEPFLRDTSQEIVKFGRSDPQIHSNSSPVASNGIEHTQINLQMAPSRFQHYGTLKNGPTLPMYDTRAAKNAAQQFSLGKPFENFQVKSSMMQVNSASARQINSVWPTTATTSVTVKNLSPPRVFPPDITDQNLAVLRQKKRKIAAFEHLPWHKEVTQGSQSLQNISKADLEWAQVTNRLMEKVEDEAGMTQVMLPMLQSKKRLILATDLTQQLFRPAATVILSADAISNCDSMTYIVSRLALGDACSMTSESQNPFDTCNMSSVEPKSSERIGEQDFSKNVGDFISRAKRLEDDLMRLDKRASIVDIRVESQELEKFSVFNRFAKFHSRGHVSAAETSTSSGTTPTVLKPSPQRYVSAFPMPRIVPEGAHCLPL